MSSKLIFIFLLIIVTIINLIGEISCEKDLYKILGVKRDATANDIKHKYRKLFPYIIIKTPKCYHLSDN